MFFDRKNITCILTAYKRNYFDEQINSLKNQSIPLDDIIIFQNENHVDLTEIKIKHNVNLIRSDSNTKFWGRFALAQIINSEYILILDDDTIPGNLWVENCKRLCDEKNCIVCANGRSTYNSEEIDNNIPVDTKTGFGGHSWFFKKDHLRYMWLEPVMSYDTGEDIHFCASAKIHGGIETWVPAQEGETSGHRKHYGGDQMASYRTNNWDGLRKKICEHFRTKGW